jgi:hypothetical protein
MKVSKDSLDSKTMSTLCLEIDEAQYKMLKLRANRMRVTVPELVKSILLDLDKED